MLRRQSGTLRIRSPLLPGVSVTEITYQMPDYRMPMPNPARQMVQSLTPFPDTWNLRAQKYLVPSNRVVLSDKETRRIETGTGPVLHTGLKVVRPLWQPIIFTKPWESS